MKKKILNLCLVFAMTVSSICCLPYTASASVSAYRVSVSKGYLALRSSAEYNNTNEIAQLHSGDTVWVYDSSNPDYWYVYSLSLDQAGYVDSSYLSSDTQTEDPGEFRTVSVKKGYLALRSMKAYEESNELGELYTGDAVQLLDTSDSQYWYVYSPKYDMNGFVNKDYLNGENNYTTRTVHVKKGYLALRSSRAYHESNEIGELYTDDIVQVIDTSDSKYWYVYSSKLNTYGYVNQNYLY